MRKLGLIVFLTVFMAVASSSGSLFAEEAETFYTFGTVTGTAEGFITIEEVVYDGETDNEITEEVVYVLDPDMEVGNAESIGDILPGSEVDLEYVEEDGKRKAVYIYLYDEEFVD